MNKSRIIVSLDFPEPSAAIRLTSQLDPERCRLKVGKELFTRAGPALIEQFVRDGYDIFLDLKYHDIPNTVASACVAAADMGVWMLNVHAAGGRAMLCAAREAIERQSQSPLLIAVTVLTSMSQTDLDDIGINRTINEQVLSLAEMARDAQLDGIVCSAREVSRLRDEFGNGFCLVTPGIRPAGASQDDQKRIMTPAEAVRAGSDYLVIGRPITRAEDPLDSLMAIEEEIDSVTYS
ncbi:MAG: orotidine-5'-phosphate decarboxylase [Gammaproteobacteria bacterium]